MAIYAIGDVQGCYDELTRLLELLNVDTAKDELWFVGDLVNRGPRSLDVLRLVASFGNAATVTLGNHDLHLLAVAQDPGKAEESLAEVLAAEDADHLLTWLRHRPLVYYRPDMNTMMIHAGVAPQWDPLQTVRLAREVETALRGDRWKIFLAKMYGQQPDRWSPELTGIDRLRFITNCLTRMRFCHADGRLEFSEKGPPGEQAEGLTPWFDLPDRATESVRIVCGHWSALGLLERSNILAIDTGCVWGRQLSAIRLDGPRRVYSVEAKS
jgi:bis(5'-nucleosyl)-tetraphosphatase (symmetrical)